MLLQYPDDLLFRKTIALDALVLVLGQSELQTGLSPWGKVSMDMRKLVGQNVKRITQEKGLTQEQFSLVSGLGQQYTSGLETGHRNPTVVTVYELAKRSA